ncbi:MAG TPA: ATP-binding protein [Piscinibacter sp.]|nr:ATP-binding protein [Piscinibacter sp.]
MHVAQAVPARHGLAPRTAALGAALAWCATPAMAAETASAGGVWAVALPSFVIGALLALWAGRRHWQALAALRRSRDELRRLEEMLDLWQWRSDAGHRLLMLKAPPGSAAASEDTTGTLLWERFTGTDAASLRSQLDGRLPLQDVEARFAPAQGGPMRRVRLQGRACVDDSGAFAGYAGTLRLLDDPLPAAPDASAETERESFSYTVSHDLRAPIRVVEGFTKILKEDYGHALDRIGNDHLDRVLGAAARMNSMIDALLTLSKLSSQPLARQPVNLSQLAAYVAEDLRRQSPGRDVLLHVEPGLQVTGDPTLLRLVLENLLGNAWKYTGKCRAPEVWLERRPQHPDTFTVRDNGAGFDMRFAERLFGVFQRLHSASDFQGTGIGLATVRRIVRRHGGEVWAEAEVERGASFHFSIPPG